MGIHMESSSPRRAWSAGLLAGMLCMTAQAAQAQETPDQELLRQQERERALRQRQEERPDVRLAPESDGAPLRLPEAEAPCFPIRRILLAGEDAARFQWALRAANAPDDPVIGRCLGTTGINIVLKRIQNAIVARGFVTTRVLAAEQDLRDGELVLTLVPGRIRAIRFDPATAPRVARWNAVPAAPGDLLNLRDIEQALENFQRVPTVSADVQIVPADGAEARAGESDLAITWQQRRPMRVNLSLDDSGSVSTGKWQAGTTLSLDNALRWNDLFYLNLGHSAFNGNRKDTSSWTAHYDVPVGYWLAGVTASAYDYRQTVAGPYQTYDYNGSSRNAELKLSRLLFRSATAKSGIYGRGWWRESKNFVDDTEIEVQRRRMAGWELGITHKQFLRMATLEGSVAYRRGTGAFGALPAPEDLAHAADPGSPLEGTSRAALITADAQLTLPFRLGKQSMRYSASWRGQWNRTPLVPQDRFAIGGRYTVRGFDGEVSLTGERGWLVRNEMGVTLGGGQEFYAGADYGRVAGPSARWQWGDHLAGIALGLRGGWRGGNWDLFVGAPLSKPDGFPTAYTTTGFSLGWSF